MEEKEKERKKGKKRRKRKEGKEIKKEERNIVKIIKAYMVNVFATMVMAKYESITTNQFNMRTSIRTSIRLPLYTIHCIFFFF